MPNIYKPEFDDVSERPGFAHGRAFVGRRAGAQRLGMSLWEIPAGDAAYPYHYHLVEEEMMIVLSGLPRLRTPSGWRDLEEGEVVSFLPGVEGGHQLMNRTDESVRILVVSTAGAPEIAIYPDSNKVGVRQRDVSAGAEGLRMNFEMSSAVDYWQGEHPPT
ncbi:MAG: cupin domain-containing protein [Solirubrobacterales bacterium]